MDVDFLCGRSSFSLHFIGRGLAAKYDPRASDQKLPTDETALVAYRLGRRGSYVQTPIGPTKLLMSVPETNADFIRAPYLRMF